MTQAYIHCYNGPKENKMYQRLRRQFWDEVHRAFPEEDAYLYKKFTNHNGRDPSGGELVTDMIYWGPRHGHDASAEAILVVSSGLHGVELEAGAMIQTKLLQTGYLHSLDLDRCGIVFLFALNPWGSAHGRRVDRRNIDPNRAACDPTDIRDNGIAISEPYTRLQHLIEPPAWGPEAEKSLREVMASQETRRAVQDVARGQYVSPHGIFYGGNGKSCWTIDVLDAVWHHLRHVPHVGILDIHTGLSPTPWHNGKGDIFSPIQNLEDDTAKRTLAWLGCGVQFPNAAGAASTSTMVSGDILSHSIRTLTRSVVTPVALELGGHVLIEEAFIRLVAENALFHTAKETQLYQMAKENLHEVFAPASDEWRGAAWARGISTIDAMAKGLGMYRR